MKKTPSKILAASSLLLLAACADENASTNPFDTLGETEISSNSETPVVENGDNGAIIIGGETTATSSNSIATSSDSSVNALSSDSEHKLHGKSSSSSAAINPASSSAAINFTSSSAGAFPISSSAETTPTSSAEVTPNAPAATENTPNISYTAAGANVQNDNGCVKANGGEVVITCAGDYEFSGSYTGPDAQIRVYSPKADSGVYLNLRGLSLTNTIDVPIYVQMASKAFVVAKKGTTNTLADSKTRSKSFTYINDKGVEKVDTTGAAIYSKDDLTIKGEGTLTVTGNYNNGIQSSNDLRFRGETTVNVTAANNGIKGKGMVDIEKGNLTIAATSGDGIKSDECTVNGSDTTITEGKGIVSIKGGKINITKAGDDGIQAFNYVMVADSESVPSIKIAATGKGIVSENRIFINGGETEINAGDDGIHSNMNIDVNGGYTTVTAKDDGFHADSTLRIKDGTVYVKNSYEGLEAWYITITGGVTDVYGSDDGWNAAGGNDASGNNNNGMGGNEWGGMGGGFGGGRGGMGGGMGGGPGGFGPGGNSSGFLTVTGGVHHIKNGTGDTDGIDSNGELTLSGGVIVVECQISGGMGGSFDADGQTSITSKTIIGFSGRMKSEKGTNYNVSFNTSSYYGNSSIAFKPSISGNYIQATSSVSAINDVNSYAQKVTFPSGSTVYYN